MLYLCGSPLDRKRHESISAAKLMGRPWPPLRRLRTSPYIAQIFQITPVPGIWTFWPLAAPTKWVSDPRSRTAP